MKVIDLDSRHHDLYFHCLEEWSDDIKEAGDHKSCWYQKYKDRGLRVKLAVEDTGRIGGMIQYLPIEESHVQGEDLLFILCIWVHGHKEGRGNLQKKGMGKALLQAAELDARESGAGGIAAWGLWLPIWMKASWFKKHGYKKADRYGMAELVWKPFKDNARIPRWIKQKKKVEAVSGKVTVTAFKSGWCPVQNLLFERTRKAASEYGDKIDFQVIDTTEPSAREEWGISDAVFINGKRIGKGPPLSYKKIKKILAGHFRRTGL